MKKKDSFFYFLTISIILGFFAVLITLIIRGGAESTVNILIGALTGAFLTVVGFYFNSSKSSEDKTEMIYNSKPTIPTNNTE